MLVYAEPIIHLAMGGIGGAIGMLIWRPIPKLPEMEGTRRRRSRLSSFSFGERFCRPGSCRPVSVRGAFIIVVGVVWSQAIMDVLAARQQRQLRHLVEAAGRAGEHGNRGFGCSAWRGFAGATTRNGLKQGLCVGLAASMIVLGIQIAGPDFVA